ncbi:MAG: hypothetical protein KDK76_07050 [Chlamydiia bacterium]|nr:hypothetical protein [Chlamydiia bacterium]
MEISQSQRLRFDPIEAASYPRDRSDADRVKDQDADTGKNQVLNRERYKYSHRDSIPNSALFNPITRFFF